MQAQVQSPQSDANNSSLRESHSFEFDDDEEEFDYKVLGSATALYTFDGESSTLWPSHSNLQLLALEYYFRTIAAPSDGAIKIQEGEKMEVIEQDVGDGWTRVRKSNGDEGFVPTSYVQIALDS